MKSIFLCLFGIYRTSVFQTAETLRSSPRLPCLISSENQSDLASFLQRAMNYNGCSTNVVYSLVKHGKM